MARKRCAWDVQPNCGGGSDSLVHLGYNCAPDQPVSISGAVTAVSCFVYPLATVELVDSHASGGGLLRKHSAQNQVSKIAMAVA
jgi:hypothetical protein